MNAIASLSPTHPEHASVLIMFDSASDTTSFCSFLAAQRYQRSGNLFVAALKGKRIITYAQGRQLCNLSEQIQTELSYRYYITDKYLVKLISFHILESHDRMYRINI